MRAKSKLTKQNSKLSTKLKQVVGKVKLPKKFDENQELRNNLEEKHLKD